MKCITMIRVIPENEMESTILSLLKVKLFNADELRYFCHQNEIDDLLVRVQQITNIIKGNI